ncbi:MAG TPA: glycosyltransferase [Deltaproteobacteria bacterium]|nr:glycosyltransferase [Deltaproteobacteria bacterium]
MILAMSYNKPILISDLPPAKEIIKDGINGFLFQAGNSFSLAQEICSVLSNPEKMEEVASNGYNFVITKLDWNVIGLLTKKTYLH